ncbi:MAG TPA: hypothetical protein VHM20_03460, partial [Gammaproteobacteria bacterium]|nr:hypothetical protein [Gammaproteobacteria bacterium]
ENPLPSAPPAGEVDMEEVYMDEEMVDETLPSEGSLPTPSAPFADTILKKSRSMFGFFKSAPEIEKDSLIPHHLLLNIKVK